MFAPLGENAVVEILPQSPALAERGNTLVGTDTRFDERALRIGRVFGDDIDDAVDGICAPYRRTAVRG